jgi:hypothetical protein
VDPTEYERLTEMTTEKIRTKARPHEELEVTATEAKDLRRMGALVEDEAPAQPENRTATASGSK